MSTAVTVLDEAAWVRRSTAIDVFALGLLVVAGIGLIRDAYALGAGFGDASALNRLLIDVALAMAAMGWVTYRLLGAARRRALP